MTPEFLAAVIDTLLPGEESPPGAMALPSGTAAGLGAIDYAPSHRQAFDAIAARAGGAESFVRADEPARIAALKGAEGAMPDAFRALLAAVLSDYYEADPVLAALGWRAEPPQPAGHVLAATDAPTAARFDRVARRGRLWRD
jgi:hypothetical protein